MSSLAASTELLALFADPTRVRLVALLAHHELTVAELVSVTQLAQSRVSTHLGRLREAGVLVDRRVGASTVHALADASMPEDARALWALLSSNLDDAAVASDRTRAAKAVAARDGHAAWPDAIAGEMERHYSPGRTWESLARGLFGLLQLGDVLDVGCGDGAIAELVAPHARSVTCFDRSEKLLAAAKARLASDRRIRFVLGDAHELPLADASIDAVLLFNVLPCVTTPARVLAEAARVLRPGGRAVVVTLAAHATPELTAPYRHLHPGFRPATLEKMLARAGLEVVSCAVTSRERRPPNFEVVSAFAEKPL